MAVMVDRTRTMRRPRVLLADVHQMVADALKRVREPRCEIAGTLNK
jgi:hypothetical protein